VLHLFPFAEIRITGRVELTIHETLQKKKKNDDSLQTAIAAAVFQDIVSPARASGIFLIIWGSAMYAWVKNRENTVKSKLKSKPPPSV
jgi:hypothetical protein